MKKILISIRPQWVAKILNGEKTIEVRKSRPKCELPCEVYIYCTKNEYLYRTNKGYFASKKPLRVGKGTEYTFAYSDEGMVVAKFTLNKVEELHPFFHWCEEVKKRTCLERDEVLDYLDSKDKSVGNPKRQGSVYAWHIDNLVIFDNPKNLIDFWTYRTYIPGCSRRCHIKLQKAPQSWCYCEV